MEKFYTKTVQKASRISMKDLILVVPHYLAINEHNLRHTTFMQTASFMDKQDLKTNHNMLIACYLYDRTLPDKKIEKSFGKEVLKYAKLHTLISEDDIEKTKIQLSKLDDNNMAYCLIKIWINIMFLNLRTNEINTTIFINNRINYTKNILVYIRELLKTEKNMNATLIITEVLENEMAMLDSFRKDKREKKEK